MTSTTRTINVLKTHKYKCPGCKYEWSVYEPEAPEYGGREEQVYNVYEGETYQPQYESGYEQPQGYDSMQGYEAQPGYEVPYQQPDYEQPTYQQPAYEQPAYEQPAYEQPAFEQPAFEQGSGAAVPPAPTDQNFYPQLNSNPATPAGG